MRFVSWFVCLSSAGLVALSCAAPPPAPPAPPPPPVTPAPPPGPEIEHVSLASVGLDASALDRQVDPCHDFYEFACGGWLAKTKIPADKPSWVRSFNVIDARNKVWLRQILKKAESTADESPKLRKIGDYYAACMDKAEVDKAGLKPIRPLLEKARHVHNVKSLARVITELHHDGIWALFDVSSDQDFKNATQYIAELDQDGLGLPDRDYYLKQDDKTKKIRKEYQAHVARMFELAHTPKRAAERAAGDVMAVETEIAKLSQSRVERRDPKKLYHKIDLSGIEQVANRFPWKRYFVTLGFPDIHAINVTSVSFFKGVNHMLHEVPMRQWRNYLEWQILHATAPALSKPFVDEAFRMKQALTGQKQQRPRWKRCVSATDSGLGELLAQPYVKEHFGPASKQAALKLVHAIGRAFVANLDHLDWMDAKTRERAKKKFEAMAYLIGYPKKWKKYPFKVDPHDYVGNVLRAQAWDLHRQLAKIGKPVDRGEWEMTPPTVNAYYTAQKNQMVFPAGILQPPFYSVKADIAVNLGAMGMVVGHELTHGFDDQGSQFDRFGNLKNWWTPAVKQQFKERTACIQHQYSQFSPLPGSHVNGKLTLGENIADNGGIKLAFAAYRALRAHAKKVKVAGGFTEDQQFFLSTGQIWCSKRRPQFAEMLLKVDPHSPPRFRVNGSLSNLSAFARAFSCKKGTPMNPDKTCSVW